MGQKKDDGLSIDVTVPAGTFATEELYRIELWSGFLANAVAAADTVRKRALIQDGIYYVKVPAAVAVTRGAYVYWTAGAGVKVGETDLANAAGTAGDSPVAKVEEVRDANGYAGLKLTGLGSIA